jgi:uncharacterized phage protein gp47/JayE
MDTSLVLVKSPNQIKTDMVSTITAGLINLGISNPQTGPGSDIDLICTALANELSIAANNIVSVADAQMPDTSSGTNLDRLLGIFGLTRRPASQAEGQITFITTAPTLVPTGSQLTGPTGKLYQVLVGGTYSNNSSIEVQSIDAGSNTNLDVGSILTWGNTPAFAQPTAAVSVAISGGVDLEDDATARARLLATLSSPPQFGNAMDFSNLAESFDPIVQKSFIYPAANGPGSLHVALVGYQNTSVNAVNRDIPSFNLQNVSNAMIGNTPEYVECLTTTVTNVNFDTSFKITIPYPVGAANNGIGGGWANFSPWPQPIGIGLFYPIVFSAVTSVTSPTQFSIGTTLSVVNGGFAPTLGVTQVQWIDRAAGWIVRTATVTAATDNGGDNWTITVNFPFTGIADGDYVFPASQNAQTYTNNVLASFANMGPGEKTNIATLLPRANREPRPAQSWTNTVDAVMLRNLINSGNEVSTCDYWYRTSTTAPAIPANILSPPNIFIPNNIGFYASGL